MVCVQCGGKTQVVNSRAQKRRNAVWRRRECATCHTVFTTGETADYGAAWRVKSADGTLEPFLRDKLFLSLHKSLQHRASALTDASELTDTVIQKLRVVDGCVARRSIAQAAEVALTRFDTVAATHYVAFHR